jgi:hypothetical protein
MDFASTMGVKSLFHYCAFHPDRFEDLVARNRIYMSDTANFNDPWDCRPCFDSSRIDEPAYADQLVGWFYRAARRRTPHLADAVHQARAAELRSNRTLIETVVAQMSDMEGEIIKRFRVACLTTQPTNILMWSHYATNHRGICLELSCDNAVVSGAFKVQYLSKYPRLDLADESDERILLPLITKSDVWAYEDEYRLIAQERSAAFAASLLTNNNYLTLPAGAIKAVILGCLASAETLGQVTEIVGRHGNSIAVRRLRRIPNVFDLAFQA